jgi:RND family efflux transporter MFP subunit
VTLEVDAFPGEAFTGEIRYVSPALNAESRALIVEAEVKNEDGRLKPGLFATARIEQADRAAGLLVPAAAVRTIAGTPRVFVIGGAAGDQRAEERVVATGQTVGDQVEIASGLREGESIVASGLDKVVDGIRVTVTR